MNLVRAGAVTCCGCGQEAGGFALGLSCGLGARSDNRAIAIATAPASTASPASCPPIRRSSSGTVADTSAARSRGRGLAAGELGDPVLGVGLAPTVGNKPEGLAGETPVPGMGGRFCCGGMLTVELGMLAFAATTLSRADPVNDNAPAAVALADICTSSPSAAKEPTFAVASNSSTWPDARTPTLHVEPCGSGHTVNFAAEMYGAEATLACTLAALLAALVLHTQMAKLAVRPALTSPELEKDSIRTQSCGVLWALCGVGDVVELGVGDGLDVLDWVGVGGGGLDELAAGDDALDAEGDCAFDEDALGVDEGVVLAESLDDGEVLGDALAEAELVLVMLAEPVGEADVVLAAEPVGEAEVVLVVDSLADAEADAYSLAL